MPVMECSSNGVEGFKWGDGGVCFTGPGAREKAEAVGRAIEAAAKLEKGPGKKGKRFSKAEVENQPKQVEKDFGSAERVEKSQWPKVPHPPDGKEAKFKGEQALVEIKKTDDELQIVWGEVYAPMIPDSQGDFMTVEGIRKMAYDFLAKGRVSQVDTNHDNNLNGSVVVESFIAREGDPDFLAEAWVVGVHVPDEALWAGIKNGEFNGFSMQALGIRRVTKLEMEIPDQIRGEVEKSGEGTGHTHTFTVSFNEGGEIIGGQTNVVNGHNHSIRKGTVTEPPDGEPTGHVHRFSIVDALTEINDA